MRFIAIICASLFANAAQADDLSATFVNPTTRYGHAALGEGHEWAAIKITATSCAKCLLSTHRSNTFALPNDAVFEDLSPRVVDLDQDGKSEILTVESSPTAGSRLFLIGIDGAIAAGDYIGQRHRWMAIIGAADFDGDGTIEVAYIETPHLGKTLKIARLNGDHFDVIAHAPSLTNHHYGAQIVESAILPCGGHALILTANADWTQVMATTFKDGKLTSVPFGPYAGAQSFQALPNCN
ncbi:MAG: VCBS repeat-containing protein [Deltaproteobacteria bacterium]